MNPQNTSEWYLFLEKSMIGKKTDVFNQETSAPEAMTQETRRSLESAKNEIDKALGITINLSNTKSFRFLRFLRRFKSQYLKGGKTGRRAFRKWARAFFSHRATDNEAAYDHVFQAIEHLQDSKKTLLGLLYPNAYIPASQSKKQICDDACDLPMCKSLDSKYDKFDLLLLCDSDRYMQDPFLKGTVKKYRSEGHRVFLIDSNNNNRKKDDLTDVSFSLKLRDPEKKVSSSSLLDLFLIREGIRDAVMILADPALTGESEHMKDYYGFVEVLYSKIAPPFSFETSLLAADPTKICKAFEKNVFSCFPSVSIVLLCYNQLDYTKQCVKSILEKTAYPNYELVIVDNCSTDGTADWLREEAKRSGRIRPVFNTENRGFAGGNNDGIRASGGEYVVLLNNDTLVTRGWLTGLVKWARREGVGMAGPVTNSIGNEAMIHLDYGKNLKKMDAAAYEYTARRMGQEYAHDGILAMFCVIFRRDLTEKIGLLDENYGVGMFEDDDYSAAVRREGLRLVLAEDVFIHHFGSVSFKKLEDETYRKLFEKNKAYYEAKWQTKWKAPHYRPGVSREE